jgi:hypothetical protein
MSNVRKMMSKLRGSIAKGRLSDLIASDEEKVAENTLRIAKNTVSLLRQGLFPGQAGAAVAEAEEWVAGLAAEIQKRIPQKPVQQPEAPHAKEATAN